MRSLLDDRFADERERFRFVFTCEDCVYFDAVNDRCAHGYPSDVHRAAAFAPGAAPHGMFCKEFELV